MFMILFYFIGFILFVLTKKFRDNSNVRDMFVFLTTTVLFSAYALPILFTRSIPQVVSVI